MIDNNCVIMLERIPLVVLMIITMLIMFIKFRAEDDT